MVHGSHSGNIQANPNHLNSGPKWGQSSEVSRESIDTCDNHFGNQCARTCVDAYVTLHLRSGLRVVLVHPVTSVNTLCESVGESVGGCQCTNKPRQEFPGMSTDPLCVCVLHLFP